MVKKITIILLVNLSISSCVNNKVSFIYQNSNSAEIFEEVKFKNLITAPDKYKSKNVEITGYYRRSFEKSALFINKSSNASKNAIWVNFHKDIPLINNLTGINLFDSYKEFEKISNRRIRIKGKFSTNLKGHLDDYIGELNEVVSIEVFE